MFSRKFQLITSIIGTICLLLLALYGLMGLLSTSAWAQQALSPFWGGSTVPFVMNYQGHVEDSAGNPLTGYYTMTIRIYDDVIATTALWEEEHQSVTVREGYFDVLLGNTTPISDTLFNEPDRFIGVTVHPHDEMVPRQRFASVPYTIHSFHATQADHALEADHAIQAERAYGLNAPDGDPQDAVYVDDEGKVGIGTTSPGATLDVVDGFQLHSVNGSTFWSERADSDFDFIQNTGSTKRLMSLHPAQGAGNPFEVYSHNGSTHIVGLVVQNNTGNVGIGTTTPQAKLHVNGDIRGKLQYTGEYAWSHGQGNMQMIHKDQGFCFITRVRGNFEKDWQKVQVFISGDYWYLGGESSAYVAVWARCAGIN